MDEIITERSGSILRVELNRPAKRNAMTSGMYLTLADIFKDAVKDGRTRVVLWHGAGDSFCAGGSPAPRDRLKAASPKRPRPSHTD